MKHRTVNIKAYTANFQLGVTTALGSRADLASSILIYLALLTVFNSIFKIFPVEELGNPLVTRGHLMWYFAITEIIVISSQGNQRELGSLIAEGQLTTLMQRPGSMMGLLLARVSGNLCAQAAVLLIVGFVASSLFSGIAMPIPLHLLPLFFVSVVTSGMIFLLCGYAVGTLEVLGPYSRPSGWIVSKLIFSFGGLFFPVMFFPEFLQHIVALTPFPSIIAAPGNFALSATLPHVLSAMAQQFFWLGITFCIALWAERRMINHVLTIGE